MRFVLATIVQGLFHLAFRALAATIRSVDNQLRGFLLVPFLLSKLLRHAAWQHAQLIQGVLHNRQQPLQPPVHPRLAQPKHRAQQSLQRIGLQIHQTEQQLLLRRAQLPFASPSALSLADLPLCRLVCWVPGCIGNAKRLM